MEKHILSKSTYIKGEQCLKQLYLLKKYPSLRDYLTPERLAILNRGTHVGKIAQQLFPGGIDAGPKHPSQYKKAVETTAKLININQKIIYEAGFQYNKTLILLDILLKNGESWDAYEIKSSKILSETYYKDAALQYFILKNSGLNIKSFFLVHINTEYILDNKLDFNRLFIKMDVTEEVKNRYSYVEKTINEKLQILENENIPDIKIGKHCFYPYNCDFIGHCWKSIEKPSIFDIPSIDLDDKFELYFKNDNLNNLLNDNKLSEVQKNHAKSLLQQTEYKNINSDFKNKIVNILNNNALAIKTLYFAPAIPIYKGTKPYQNIIFAFAIAPINNQNEDIQYFIHLTKDNPEEYILRKINELTKNKKLIKLNDKFENSNTIELNEILKENFYYHPEMKNDFSNKSISKALKIKTPWKAIESDIIAAKLYENIQSQNIDNEEITKTIVDYLKREIILIQKFTQKILEL